MEKTHKAVTGGSSPLASYQDVMLGNRSLVALLYYEWCLLLGPIPGMLGLALRKVFWPRLFASCGSKCVFAAGIVLRQPGRIQLGKSVVISEGCVLDARHGHAGVSMSLGDNVILSNNVMLSCKNGTISIGDNVGLNAQTIVQSTNDCPVIIGADAVVGQRCFIIGGGSYNIDRLDLPIREQGIRRDTGVEIGEDVWLGGNVTVLGGVRMGRGSVAGAGAVVTGPVAEYAVCLGVPAKVVRTRQA